VGSDSLRSLSELIARPRRPAQKAARLLGWRVWTGGRLGNAEPVSGHDSRLDLDEVEQILVLDTERKARPK
jgi:hypothetical protein